MKLRTYLAALVVAPVQRFYDAGPCVEKALQIADALIAQNGEDPDEDVMIGLNMSLQDEFEEPAAEAPAPAPEEEHVVEPTPFDRAAAYAVDCAMVRDGVNPIGHEFYREAAALVGEDALPALDEAAFEQYRQAVQTTAQERIKTFELYPIVEGHRMENTPVSKAAAHGLGMFARRCGLPVTVNPYPPRTAEDRQFRAGYEPE